SNLANTVSADCDWSEPPSESRVAHPHNPRRRRIACTAIACAKGISRQLCETMPPVTGPGSWRRRPRGQQAWAPLAADRLPPTIVGTVPRRSSPVTISGAERSWKIGPNHDALAGYFRATLLHDAVQLIP